MINLNKKMRSGFTIIELMIVLIIVAIMVALAYPAYSDYVRRAKRHAAEEALLNWSIQQEIWRSNNTGYNDCGPDDAGCTYIGPDPNDTPDYTLTVAVPETGVEYTLTATAQGDQAANDKARDGTACTPLSLNQNSDKSPAVCWK